MLSLDCEFSFALPLPFPRRAPFTFAPAGRGFTSPNSDAPGSFHVPFLVPDAPDDDEGCGFDTSGSSSDETSPVSKKSGSVCWRIYIARPTSRA